MPRDLEQVLYPPWARLVLSSGDTAVTKGAMVPALLELTAWGVHGGERGRAIPKKTKIISDGNKFYK